MSPHHHSQDVKSVKVLQVRLAFFLGSSLKNMMILVGQWVLWQGAFQGHCFFASASGRKAWDHVNLLEGNRYLVSKWYCCQYHLLLEAGGLLYNHEDVTRKPRRQYWHYQFTNFIKSYLRDSEAPGFNAYTPENKHGTWKYPLGKGETSTNHQFLGSMFVLGGVSLHSPCFLLKVTFENYCHQRILGKRRLRTLKNRIRPYGTKCKTWRSSTTTMTTTIRKESTCQLSPEMCSTYCYSTNHIEKVKRMEAPPVPVRLRYPTNPVHHHQSWPMLLAPARMLFFDHGFVLDDPSSLPETDVVLILQYLFVFRVYLLGDTLLEDLLFYPIFLNWFLVFQKPQTQHGNPARENPGLKVKLLVGPTCKIH